VLLRAELDAERRGRADDRSTAEAVQHKLRTRLETAQADLVQVRLCVERRESAVANGTGSCVIGTRSSGGGGGRTSRGGHGQGEGDQHSAV
jgi:hypothetical protein